MNAGKTLPAFKVSMAAADPTHLVMSAARMWLPAVTLHVSLLLTVGTLVDA